jgi:hypothetical protein
MSLTRLGPSTPDTVAGRPRLSFPCPHSITRITPDSGAVPEPAIWDSRYSMDEFSSASGEVVGITEYSPQGEVPS